MTTVDKVISCINSADPIGYEAILMDLKKLRATHSLFFNNLEEFNKKHSLQEFHNMENDFESKLKNLTGLETVPTWQIIYFNLFNN